MNAPPSSTVDEKQVCDMRRLFIHFTVFLSATIVAACSKPQLSDKSRVRTTPVSGIIKIDGEPRQFVKITCYPDKDNAADIKAPAITTTDAAGKFSFSTYTSGDGLPVGKYKLTFAWEQLSGFRGQKKDRLNNAYSDPETSKYDLYIIEIAEQDIGTITLFTRKQEK